MALRRAALVALDREQLRFTAAGMTLEDRLSPQEVWRILRRRAALARLCLPASTRLSPDGLRAAVKPQHSQAPGGGGPALTAPEPEPGDTVSAAPVTPYGRYFVVRGRLWRCSNPSLEPARRAALVQALMAARQAKGPKTSVIRYWSSICTPS